MKNLPTCYFLLKIWLEIPFIWICMDIYLRYEINMYLFYHMQSWKKNVLFTKLTNIHSIYSEPISSRFDFKTFLQSVYFSFHFKLYFISTTIHLKDYNIYTILKVHILCGYVYIRNLFFLFLSEWNKTREKIFCSHVYTIMNLCTYIYFRKKK